MRFGAWQSLQYGQRSGTRARTWDIKINSFALCQLSYTRSTNGHSPVVALAGVEPATPALSERCSNHLSYKTVHARPPVHPGQGVSLPGAGWAPPHLPHAQGRGADPTICRAALPAGDPRGSSRLAGRTALRAPTRT